MHRSVSPRSVGDLRTEALGEYSTQDAAGDRALLPLPSIAPVVPTDASPPPILRRRSMSSDHVNAAGRTDRLAPADARDGRWTPAALFRQGSFQNVTALFNRVSGV